MDDYVERIQFEGYIDSSGAATWELNWGGVPQMENWGGGGGVELGQRGGQSRADGELCAQCYPC